MARASRLWAILLVPLAVHAAALPQYTLRDYLDKAWQSERVTYSVSLAESAALRRGARLVDVAGDETPWQLSTDGESVSFLASVPAFGESTYRFEQTPSARHTRLSVTETADTVELVNGRTGVRLSKAMSDGAGPIAGWRLASGKWVGASRFVVGPKIVAYDVSIRERGPVFAVAAAQVQFEDGGTWSLTVELQADEPLFKIRERFACKPGAGRMALVLSTGFDPEWLLYRSAGQFDFRGGRTRLGQLIARRVPPDKPGKLFLLEPWVHWQFSMNRGTWFSLIDPGAEDALFTGTGDSPCWVEPSIPAAERARPNADVQRDRQGNIVVDFEVKRGEREYFLGSLPTAAVMADLHGKVPPRTASDPLAEAMADEERPEVKALLDALKRAPYLLDGVPAERLHRAPLPQQYLIKHSDFPLNRVKDMVLEWDAGGDPREHPCLLVRPQQVAALRETLKVSDKELARLRRMPISVHNLDDVIPPYLATQDKVLAQRLVAAAIEKLQAYTSGFVRLSNDNVSVGVAPHHRKSIVAVVNLVDAILTSDQLTDGDRRLLRGQLAFLGYQFNSPAYWSAPRGYGAMFVNMHTTVASLQCALAAILPDHPEHRAWMNRGMAYMRGRLLDRWIDDQGRWCGNTVEAPHYAMSSYDDVLAATIMAERTGLGDDVYGPAIKLTGEWFAKISTPRDPRILGWRHLPPIGNTYKFEPSGIFGILAGVYRENDPDFSAAMQWMQKQHGDPLQPGVGGAAPSLAGYRRVLSDPTLPAKGPDWGSEWFRGAGAVLRSQYGTDDEMMLYMIAGVGASPVRHYDRDQGAITIWGRGVPIADDFGYNGCAPPEDQSLLTSATAKGNMAVKALNTGDAFDYLEGRQGGWLRQIALVKRPPASPDAPEYFVIHDSLDKPAAAVWRLWLTAEPVKLGSGSALFVGRKPKAGADPVDGLLDAALDMGDGDGGLPNADTLRPQQDKQFSVGLGPRDVLVNGHAGRQTDIWFAALPPGAAIKTELKTRAPAGVDGNGRYQGSTPTSQIGLILESDTFSSLLTLVFPRMKDDPPPVVTSVADGRGFVIKHAHGRDYVFVSEKPLGFTEENVRFEGRVGVVRSR